MRFKGPLVAAVGISCALAAPVAAAPHTTVDRTIEDRDGDNLLEPAPGDDYVVFGADQDFRPPRQGSIVNFLQLSDFQVVDEESPGRVEFLDTTQRNPFTNPFSAAYRPQEALTTQITEAMVRQARNTTSEITGEQLEFTILTGDNADSQQYNETRWFIDILDGTTGDASVPKIDPDSGIPAPGCDPTPGTQYDGVQGGGKPGYYDPDRSDAGDDTTDGDGYSPLRDDNGGPDEYPQRNGDRSVTVRDFPDLLERAQEPFEAVGLGMPWYTAFGNHDALVQGNSPDAYFGPGGVTSSPETETANEGFQSIVKGCLKPTRLPAGLAPEDATDVIGDPGLLAESAPLVVPPDPRRCYLAKDQVLVRAIPATDPCQTGWVQEHFKTTGIPAGHGFANRPPEAEANNDGYYSFSPKPGLRFIGLDTVTDECGAPLCAEGSIDNTQFEWLRRELLAAEAAGEYVFTYGHHSLRTTRMPNPDPTEQPVHYGERDQNPSGAETLEELFCDHPSVLAHVVGHEHQNEVRDHRCSAEEGTLGPGRFIEVTTAAHIDWPQQSRMIELVANGNGTLSLVLTIIDHAGPANPGAAPPDPTADGQAPPQILRLAGIGRELAYNDPQGDRGARGGEDDRNVIYVLEPRR